MVIKKTRQDSRIGLRCWVVTSRQKVHLGYVGVPMTLVDQFIGEIGRQQSPLKFHVVVLFSGMTFESFSHFIVAFRPKYPPTICAVGTAIHW